MVVICALLNAIAEIITELTLKQSSMVLTHVAPPSLITNRIKWIYEVA